MNNDEIEKLNDHMVHALGRINHLELQVRSLAAAVARLQIQVNEAAGKNRDDDAPQDYYAKKG